MAKARSTECTKTLSGRHVFNLRRYPIVGGEAPLHAGSPRRLYCLCGASPADPKAVRAALAATRAERRRQRGSADLPALLRAARYKPPEMVGPAVMAARRQRSGSRKR